MMINSKVRVIDLFSMWCIFQNFGWGIFPCVTCVYSAFMRTDAELRLLIYLKGPTSITYQI